jgi:hypothetical protein
MVTDGKRPPSLREGERSRSGSTCDRSELKSDRSALINDVSEGTHPQYGFLLTVVSVCGQDKFSALLPRPELVATLYLCFRKFQIRNDILIT